MTVVQDVQWKSWLGLLGGPDIGLIVRNHVYRGLRREKEDAIFYVYSLNGLVCSINWSKNLFKHVCPYFYKNKICFGGAMCVGDGRGKRKTKFVMYTVQMDLYIQSNLSKNLFYTYSFIFL